MSSSIITRIDEMGNRIDDLEKSISDLMSQVVYTNNKHTLFILSFHIKKAGIEPDSTPFVEDGAK